MNRKPFLTTLLTTTALAFTFAMPVTAYAGHGNDYRHNGHHEKKHYNKSLYGGHHVKKHYSSHYNKGHHYDRKRGHGYGHNKHDYGYYKHPYSRHAHQGNHSHNRLALGLFYYP